MSDVDFTYEEKRHAGAQFFRALALEMIELTASDLAKPLPDPLDRTTTASRRRAEHEGAMNGSKSARRIRWFRFRSAVTPTTSRQRSFAKRCLRGRRSCSRRSAPR